MAKLLISLNSAPAKSLSGGVQALSPFHAFAVRVVSSLYHQEDAERMRPILVNEMYVEISSMIEAAVATGKKMAEQGTPLGNASIVLPSAMTTFARKWYKRLHDDFERETVDRHYIENVRKIGTELTLLLREVAQEAIDKTNQYHLK